MEEKVSTEELDALFGDEEPEAIRLSSAVLVIALVSTAIG